MELSLGSVQHRWSGVVLCAKQGGRWCQCECPAICVSSPAMACREGWRRGGTGSSYSDIEAQQWPRDDCGRNAVLHQERRGRVGQDDKLRRRVTVGGIRALAGAAPDGLLGHRIGRCSPLAALALEKKGREKRVRRLEGDDELSGVWPVDSELMSSLEVSRDAGSRVEGQAWARAMGRRRPLTRWHATDCPSCPFGGLAGGGSGSVGAVSSGTNPPL